MAKNTIFKIFAESKIVLDDIEILPGKKNICYTKDVDIVRGAQHHGAHISVVDTVSDGFIEQSSPLIKKEVKDPDNEKADDGSTEGSNPETTTSVDEAEKEEETGRDPEPKPEIDLSNLTEEQLATLMAKLKGDD